MILKNCQTGGRGGGRGVGKIKILGEVPGSRGSDIFGGKGGGWKLFPDYFFEQLKKLKKRECKFLTLFYS